ncbi:MAG: hypothetical protein KDD42_04595 [Bdellovibrionales bacterium]|nr:hypothetical protein [Bdellovibrionales bacterium]
MQINYIKFTFFPILFGYLIGCSSSVITDTPSPSEAEPLPTLQLFLSRSALGVTEFEQYNFGEGILHQECGKIKRGRFIPEDEAISHLNAANLSELQQSVKEVLDLSDSELKLPSAGDNSSWADPGMLEIKIGTKNYHSSVDAISAGKGLAATKIKQFVEKIRRISNPKKCGNKTFYGIAG